MNKIYIFLGYAILLVSCGRDYPPNVASTVTLLKQLAENSNNEIDLLVKKVENNNDLQEHNQPLEIIRSSNETEVIMAIFNASIEGEINVDSLGITKKNTFFLSSGDNIGNVDFNTKESVFTKDGLYGNFRQNTRNKYKAAANIWRAASTNYIVQKGNAYKDSITEKRKNEIELNYSKNVQPLKDLKYVILEEDALLVMPIVDEKKKGFTTGYVVTQLYVYDIESLKKVGQTMLISTNSDEISYSSLNNNRFTDYDEIMIKGQLRMNLIMQKSKNIDSLFIKDGLIL